MQPLAPNASTRASLAGGEEIVFSIDVPAHTAARLVVRQQGIDVGVTLRIAGSALPEHGLNMVGGRYGEEVRYIAISDAPATWHIFIKAAPPRAPRGDFTIATEHKPADDHARAIAEVRQIYQAASDTAWAGDGKSFEKARELYMAVAKRALEIGDKELAAESTYETARMFDQFGEVPTAIEWQLRALVLFRELNRRDRQSRVLNRLGDLSRKIGEVIHSEGYFKEALPLARETGDQYALVDILNNSGLLHLSIGRLEEALDQLQSAIPLAQELNSANVEVALWNNSGEAYLRLGLREQAVAAHERALDRVRRSDLPKRRLGRTLHLLAVAYFETGNGAKAEVSLREALLVFEQAKDAAHTADALGFLGRMQHANGDAVSAVASFERALPMLQQAQNRLGQGTVLMTWSQVDLDRANTDASLEKLQTALNLFRQTGNRSAQAKALYLRALSLQQKQNIDAAIEAISEAIEIIEVMRSEITRVELRTSYLAAMRRYYDLYIDLLQQRGRTADAFSVSERARARTLLESLAESATKIRKGVDPALLKRERTVQAELNAKTVYRAQVVLKEGEKSTRAVALGNATEQLLDEWKEIQAKIRASSPAYAALRMPQPVTAESVQKSLLDSDSALIAYHLGDSRTYAWVIDKRSITVHSLASIETR